MQHETSREDDMIGMLHDAFEVVGQIMDMNLGKWGLVKPNIVASSTSRAKSHTIIDNFQNLMKYADEELNSGCMKFSKLSFLLHLYHMKCSLWWCNGSLNALFKLLKDVLPESASVLNSFNEM